MRRPSPPRLALVAIGAITFLAGSPPGAVNGRADATDTDAAGCLPTGTVASYSVTPALDLTVAHRTMTITVTATCQGAGDDNGTYSLTMTGTEVGNCQSGTSNLSITGSGPEGAATGSISFLRSTHFWTQGLATLISGGETHGLQLWFDLANLNTCPGPTTGGQLLLADGVVNDVPGSYPDYGWPPPPPPPPPSPCVGAALDVVQNHVQALDPVTTYGSLQAQPSVQPRHYDEIKEFCVFPGSLALGFPHPMEKFVIITNGPQPSWPATPSGDTGTQWQACGDAGQGPGNIGQDAVQIGTAATGAPIYDGPYSPSEGWKACVYATFGVGQVGSAPIQTAWAWKDPAGDPRIIDANNGLLLPPASWVGNIVRIYAPETLNWRLDCATSGCIPTTASETPFPNDHSKNVTVESLATIAGALPTPICPGVGDCLQTLATVGLPVHWAPGWEMGVGASAVHVPGIDLGIDPNRPSPATCEDTNGGDDAAEPAPTQSDVQTPNCVVLSGTTPVPWEYHAMNGRQTAHDDPAVSPPTVAGPGLDHLGPVYDFTGIGY